MFKSSLLSQKLITPPLSNSEFWIPMSMVSFRKWWTANTNMLDNKLGFNNRSCFNGRTSVNKCVVYSAFRAMYANPKHRETELFAYLSGKHTFPCLLNSFLYVLAIKSILFTFGLKWNHYKYELRVDFDAVYFINLNTNFLFKNQQSC